MCGIIFAPVGVTTGDLTHRGPDQFDTHTQGVYQMKFHRLAINGVERGMQPFVRPGEALMCNGEIFNHKELEDGTETTGSDCECLFSAIHKDKIPQIRGEFAFVWTDGDKVVAARDPYGVRPLFYCRLPGGSLAFASEAKALIQIGQKVNVFPPGTIYRSDGVEI